MTMVGPEFNPHGVAIDVKLSVAQVDLILEGLQSLPISKAGEFFFGLKQHAERTIAAARAAHESLHTQPPATTDEPTNTAAAPAKEA